MNSLVFLLFILIHAQIFLFSLHLCCIDSVFLQVNGTALHVAAACGNTTIVSALLNWGIDLDVVDCVSYIKKILMIGHHWVWS